MKTLRTSRPNAETKAPAENLYPQKEQPQLDNTLRQTDFFSPKVSFKKTLLIALLLLITALSFAEIYTIGSDYTYNTNIPLTTMMAYSWSKSLISVADIQTAGLNGVAAITAIGFYPAGESPSRTFTNQEIYLRNTDLAVQNNSCPNIEDYSLAYRGDVTFQGGDWNTCTFSIPFIWDGLSNIEIVWLNNHGVSYTGSFFFRNDYVANYATAHKFGSTALPTGDGSLDYIRPYMQIHALQSPSPLLSIYPTALDFGEISLNGEAEPLNIQALNCGQGTLDLSEADISISGSGADFFSFDASNLPAALEMGESVQIPVNVSADIVGTLSATLTITYAGMAHAVSLSASITSPGLVEIGDGTNHYPQPFDISWGYGRSATIYTMEDIGRVGMIESIGWYCSSPSYQVAPYRILVGPTLYDVIPSGYPDGYYTNVSQGLTLVSQGSQAFNSIGWYMFELDTPIAYSGENLLIAVETNFGNSGVSNCPYFSYTEGETYSHCYWRTQNQPPSSTGHISTCRPNLRMVLGDITINPQLSVSPQSIDFGTVFSGITTGPINITLSNTGVGTLVINEDDVSLTGADAAIFSYDESLFPLTIFTDHSITIPLYMTPTEEGNISANFVINYAGEEYVVELTANVLTHQGTFFAELGDGTAVNPIDGYPAPYGTHYRSFREQYLIKADELHALNGGSGVIESIAFNVADLNDTSPMNNYRIRLKHTDQDELNTTFELGDYTEVFQAQILTPQTGWNTHIFQTPFDWNGISNILVDIIVSFRTSASHNSSTYYTNYPHNCTLRWQANNANPDYATTGELSTNRPNMIISMHERNFMDIAAVSVSGNKLPSANRSYDYTVSIHNLSPLPASGYQVKLMAQQDNNPPFVIDSIEGATLQPLEHADMVFSWTPTSVGDVLVYGTISYDDDEYLNNNDTPPLAVEVMEAVYQVIQLGDGTATFYPSGGNAPYGTYNGAFRQQYLYQADEIADKIDSVGLINAIAFHILDLYDSPTMRNYRIRLKHTTQTSLSDEFELGDYTLVFSAPILTLTTGWNTHYFTQPFVYNGIDNILVDILTDFPPASYVFHPRVYYSPTTFNSSLRFQSYNTAPDYATLGVTDINRSNTRLYMETDGMGSLTGMVLEDGYPVPNMLITMEDTVFNTTTNQDGVYHFPYIYAGTHVLVASKHCYDSVSQIVTIEEGGDTVHDFTVYGTPEFSVSDHSMDFGFVPSGDSETKDFRITNTGGGTLTIYSIDISGSDAFTISQIPVLPITLRSDEYIALNIGFEPTQTGVFEATITITDDQGRNSYEAPILGVGVNSFTIGDDAYLFRYPFDFYYSNSLFQTIFTNDELGGFHGVITGIKLYNVFNRSLNDKHVKIWMASTPLSDLSDGWISSDDMTLVFDGIVDFPAGENTIDIDFPEHFLFAEGENLAVLFYKPTDQQYTSSVRFLNFASRENSTRHYETSFNVINPANTTGGLTGYLCPVITFEGIPGGVGYIQGVIHNSAGVPLSDVSITLSQHDFTCYSDEDGMFLINNIWPGEYVLSCSRYDYLDYSIQVLVEEDITSELDIVLEESPLVSITGTVVAADTGEGIPGAEITLSGCAEYSATTNAMGEFIIDSNVYAQNKYAYHITATGFTPLTGTIELGLQDYDMETITMYEIAYMPAQVLAELNGDESSVNISWDAPTPDSGGISRNKTYFMLAQKTPASKDRAFLHYNVWRLKSGQELLEQYWVLLAEELTETSLIDAVWDDLPSGLYRWAVKAVYSEDIISEAAFSNSIEKGNVIGTLSGIVTRYISGDLIEGALISAGQEYSALTLEDGSYMLYLPAGTYRITASHKDFYPLTEGGIHITAGQNTHLNFVIGFVSSEDVVEVTATALHSNYPNPFNPETTISYDLKEPAKVQLNVYNLKGQLVRTLVNSEQTAGRHNVVFTARDERGNKLSSGLYFYRLRAGDYIKTRKMMLME